MIIFDSMLHFFTSNFLIFPLN